MNDFTAQFTRENRSRVRQGLKPYPDITAYLVAQGFSQEEAAARAAASQLASSDQPVSVAVTDDVTGFYDQANAGHHRSIYGAEASADAKHKPHADNAGNGGRIARVNSPADFITHADQRGEDDASLEEHRDLSQMATDVYRKLNASYSRATGKAQAQSANA